MISFGVWKYMFVISDFFLLINVISCGSALFIFIRVGLMLLQYMSYIKLR